MLQGLPVGDEGVEVQQLDQGRSPSARRAASARVASSIVDGKEDEIGPAVAKNAAQSVRRIGSVQGQAQGTGHWRLHQAGPGGDVGIGPVQFPAMRSVIGRDMVVFEPLRWAERQPMRCSARSGNWPIPAAWGSPAVWRRIGPTPGCGTTPADEATLESALCAQSQSMLRGKPTSERLCLGFKQSEVADLRCRSVSSRRHNSTYLCGPRGSRAPQFLLSYA
ncbi:hypothetical protein MPLB_1990063 [Mesorhizobium sp. ORS 3324]|nr:hypothetical protein MPLB_1990063 [Mesorhizobium sp. ORS 3324]